MFNNFYFFKNRSIYEIVWKHTLETDRPQITIRRMWITCWITKTIHTHSEYVILFASPRQQWLSERAGMLCSLPRLFEMRGKRNHRGKQEYLIFKVHALPGFLAVTSAK